MLRPLYFMRKENLMMPSEYFASKRSSTNQAERLLRDAPSSASIRLRIGGGSLRWQQNRIRAQLRKLGNCLTVCARSGHFWAALWLALDEFTGGASNVSTA